MADPSLKNLENVLGRYYVDQECIDCHLCSQIAPDNFARSIIGGYDYVSMQPSCPLQEELCQEAMECCPVEAIGDDGDVF